MLQFNKETNDTKRKLLLILSQRFTADENLQDRMIRVENVNNLVHAKSYDIDVVTKLNELQNRQRIVAENHANLMNTVYALSLIHIYYYPPNHGYLYNSIETLILTWLAIS